MTINIERKRFGVLPEDTMLNCQPGKSFYRLSGDVSERQVRQVERMARDADPSFAKENLSGQPLIERLTHAAEHLVGTELIKTGAVDREMDRTGRSMIHLATTRPTREGAVMWVNGDLNLPERQIDRAVTNVTNRISRATKITFRKN